MLNDSEASVANHSLVAIHLWVRFILINVNLTNSRYRFFALAQNDKQNMTLPNNLPQHLLTQIFAYRHLVALHVQGIPLNGADLINSHYIRPMGLDKLLCRQFLHQ